MSCIVYQVNKKSGIKYAYESVSYWDKEKQQPRSRRKYLGRVDPETGEIIKNARNRSDDAETPEDNSAGISSLHDEIRRKDGIISGLANDLAASRKKYEALAETVRQLKAFIAEKLPDV